jgi:hypothetical protein
MHRSKHNLNANIFGSIWIKKFNKKSMLNNKKNKRIISGIINSFSLPNCMITYIPRHF